VDENPTLSQRADLDERTQQFYRRVFDALERRKLRYCVGGAYAFAPYTSIVRHTKDLDIFLRRGDLPNAVDELARAGFRIEHTHPHWLAKAFAATVVGDNDPTNGAFVDLIFRAASGVWVVDDDWLNHAVRRNVVGRLVPICAAEELIWSKAMVMERDRFDGADIAHLLRACGMRLDWPRLLSRATGHSGLLLGHLVFYRYIYPSPEDAQCVPDWVVEELFQRMRREPPPSVRLCRGTLVSWNQYLHDVDDEGLVDARLRPWGALSAEEIKQWTDAPK
jgi:hypothetical protein